MLLFIRIRSICKACRFKLLRKGEEACRIAREPFAVTLHHGGVGGIEACAVVIALRRYLEPERAALAYPRLWVAVTYPHMVPVRGFIPREPGIAANARHGGVKARIEIRVYLERRRHKLRRKLPHGLLHRMPHRMLHRMLQVNTKLKC